MKISKTVFRRTAALAGLFLLVGCSAPEEERLNLLLVTFDTTRADRIGCYGNDRVQTPTLDGLAAGGVRFSRALATVPITAPSHSSILTGRYPIAHGVRDNGLFVLGDDQLTLAEMLGQEGYATAAAIGAYPLISRFGLDQGFELFDDHLTGGFENHLGRRAVPKERLFFDERRAAQVNEALLPWLEDHATSGTDRPFFAWVHYFDPHQPFEPAPPYDQLYADALYDGEIAYADSRLGFLLDRLEELGELERTLVVMTADHGEGLGEHGELTHAILAYNSTLHVPLIVKAPGERMPAGRVVDDWVSTVDIVPTVLELLGIERPEGLQGRSLVHLWEEETPAEPSRRRRYAENLSPRLSHGWGELRVLFEGPMKYIHGPRPELYDLDDDPGELRDLAAERPEEARRLRDILEQFIERNAVEGASAVESLDDEVKKRLESLGYLHSSASAGEVIRETLMDEGIPPRDRVGDINDLSSAKHLLFEGRLADALHYTRKLLRDSPENPLYLELHAGALLGLGEVEEALTAVEQLGQIGTVPEHLRIRSVGVDFDRGNHRRAVDALRAHLESAPSARAWWVLASFHTRLGETAAAREALDQALEVDPKFYPARVDLGVHLARQGELAVAEQELRQAMEDGPYYAKAFYNLGTLTLHQERYEEAAGYFRRALSLAPRYLEAHLALVVTHLDAGDLALAEEARDVLKRIAPASEQAQKADELLAERTAATP